MQAPGAERLGGASDRDDLGVSGGILPRLPAVKGARDDLAAVGDDGADGDIAEVLSAARLLEREVHELFVVFHGGEEEMGREKEESQDV